MPLEIGQTLDAKYRIVRVIGVGGMGAVYEGEHTLIRRRVAIKVLGEGLGANAGQHAPLRARGAGGRANRQRSHPRGARRRHDRRRATATW